MRKSLFSGEPHGKILNIEIMENKVFGALTLVNALTLGVLIRKTYKAPDRVVLYPGERCIGDPKGFLTGGRDPNDRCDSVRTRGVVIRLSGRQYEPTGANILVPLCDKHLAQAEIEHQKNLPEFWESSIFPMRSPTQRKYSNEPRSWDAPLAK